MANLEQVEILKQGASVWNSWRYENNRVSVDLNDANLSELDLSYTNLIYAKLCRANLSSTGLWGADLKSTDISHANLSGAFIFWAELNFANFSHASLKEADFTEAKLSNANFSYANLQNTAFHRADLTKANFNGANLNSASFSGADLSKVNFRQADLSGSNLSKAILVGTDFEDANISDCRIFGIAAWNLRNVESLKQSNLIMTDEGEPEITVDNLEIAQFIYLLLNNAKLRGVIDTLTTKSVLILGRFTPERKAVLDGIREALRQHGYVPMLFDFEKPTNRDLTETVMTLASLARFVIADLSDPNSIPHELMSFADKLFSVPVQGIFCPTEAHKEPYPMYEHLRRLPHVLPIYRYETADELMAALEEKVIRPAEDKVKAVRPTSGLL